MTGRSGQCSTSRRHPRHQVQSTIATLSRLADMVPQWAPTKFSETVPEVTALSLMLLRTCYWQSRWKKEVEEVLNIVLEVLQDKEVEMMQVRCIQCPWQLKAILTHRRLAATAADGLPLLIGLVCCKGMVQLSAAADAVPL